MKYWNEYDIVQQERRARNNHCPNRLEGVDVVARLKDWADRNSDGWAYWPKPVRAAKNLMVLVESGDHWVCDDVTETELKRALVPVKSFLTRHGVEHSEVLV